MNPTPFQTCCKLAAIKAFEQGVFYPVGCETCGTVFSITDDFPFFLDHIIAFHKIHRSHPSTSFDLVLYNGTIIFLLP